MNVDTLRTAAQGVMFATLGVPITITRPTPDDTPIDTRGIWLTRPLDEAQAVGTDYQRREPRKVLVIPRGTLLPTCPRGSTILAPELAGGPVKNWRADGFEQPAEVDEWRIPVVLIADP